MKDRVKNDIVLDESLVWVLSGNKPFSYSDGLSSERYLSDVFNKTTDLSASSFELQKWIRDWPSEYHLSHKRAQLLRGFNFDKGKRVLEVGCGCGAITRFLGETFDDVIGVEGSLVRARLARERTKDLNNVSILCGPFQEIKFTQQFEIIFCIGVFEYSGSYTKAENPYEFILQHFKDILAEDGVLIIAIENQFGLKYFSSSREDHTNIMFEGVEGYPHSADRVRTFGYDEFKMVLSKYFKSIEFYFPYPDYKIPSCILSETFLCKVKAGELIGNFSSRDYQRKQKPLFDERLVLLELDKNSKLPFFSNSFLVVAGKKNTLAVRMDALGLVFSSNRVNEFQTVTKIIEQEDGNMGIRKTLHHSVKDIHTNKLIFHPIEETWIDGLSLQAQIMKRIKEEHIGLKELFSPCQIWLKTLKSLSSEEGGKFLVDGKYLDCTWSNAFIHNSDCVFIDLEWEWHKKIDVNLIVIRSIFNFMEHISAMNGINPALRKMISRRLLFLRIAESFGAILTKRDFKDFCEIESDISQIVFGSSKTRYQYFLNIYFSNKILFLLYRVVKKIPRLLNNFLAKIAIFQELYFSKKR